MQKRISFASIAIISLFFLSTNPMEKEKAAVTPTDNERALFVVLTNEFLKYTKSTIGYCPVPSPHAENAIFLTEDIVPNGMIWSLKNHNNIRVTFDNVVKNKTLELSNNEFKFEPSEWSQSITFDQVISYTKRQLKQSLCPPPSPSRQSNDDESPEENEKSDDDYKFANKDDEKEEDSSTSELLAQESQLHEKSKNLIDMLDACWNAREHDRLSKQSFREKYDITPFKLFITGVLIYLLCDKFNLIPTYAAK